MDPSVAGFYRSKKETYLVRLKSLSSKIRNFALYRTAAFLLIFLPLILTGWNGWWSIILMGVPAFLFFFLIKKNLQLERQKRKFEVLEKIVSDELLALEHRFGHFENGEEFKDTDHFFSNDLDIFGEDSVFQFINRTSTISGRNKLAGWLQNPFREKKEILRHQEAIRELSVIPNWRLHFRANGYLFKETAELSGEIRVWSETELRLAHARAIPWLFRLVPVLTLAALVYAILGYSWLPVLVMVFAQWILLYAFWKPIQHYFNFFGRKSQLLGKYQQLLEFIEERDFKASYLAELRGKVCRPQRASHLFRRLKKLVDQFEYRQNLLVGLVLNSLFLWDLRCVYKLWQWHRQNRKRLASWLEVIAKTDALISLANFAHNNQEYAYPVPHDAGFTFRTEDMGHPLLPPGKRVCNTFGLDGWSKVVIVTGANMAGKSTFLRTVGVNLVLARTGAPVCARKMTFSPVGVYTDMRTTDSLLKDESYFFAELKRIKGVLEKLEKGERIFVILDEMLKGTNSVDKLNGSRALIRKLLALKAVALIATHDLKLSEMEEEHPQQVMNKCFEIRIKENELIFDYLLSDGVTQTMNATFLMKRMGIIE